MHLWALLVPSPALPGRSLGFRIISQQRTGWRGDGQRLGRAPPLLISDALSTPAPQPLSLCGRQGLLLETLSSLFFLLPTTVLLAGEVELAWLCRLSYPHLAGTSEGPGTNT